MVDKVGLEPTTQGLEARCSIQLSYLSKLPINYFIRLFGQIY